MFLRFVAERPEGADDEREARRQRARELQKERAQKRTELPDSETQVSTSFLSPFAPTLETLTLHYITFTSTLLNFALV